jgi:hypothetical protein
MVAVSPSDRQQFSYNRQLTQPEKQYLTWILIKTGDISLVARDDSIWVALQSTVKIFVVHRTSTVHNTA